ncbi:PREDICTED: surfeit locus protein 1 [Tarenaya hassleriana]|uniref:surfeit locus protein 1 n=1 Tax=Tarenaya hassleriana TaxID=28532 RepID=UPI00053C54F7|nr:PREDICTED: surfeit locus protein 1 [Tarenaya hassleriana]
MVLSKTLARLSPHRSSTSLPSRLPHHFSFRQTTSSGSAALGAHPISSAPAQEDKLGSKWSKLLLFLPGAITFGLGTWQIIRRREKIEMLEYRHQRLKMEPMKLNTEYSSSVNPDALEFRRVACKGVFDEQRSIYLGPRSRAISGVTENGYYVITPLMPIPGDLDSVQSPILVNRGWVPRSWREKSLESKDMDVSENQSAKASDEKPWWKFWSKRLAITEDQVAALTTVEVIGVIRGSENPSIFVPPNDPSSGQWFYVDVPVMARAVGLPENTIYIEDTHEDINPSRPYPVPKDVNTLIRSKVMPQDHLNYSLTWYSLSGAVTFMAYKRLRPKPTRR